MTVGRIKNTALVALTALVVCLARLAQANGAFPDSMGILLPVEKPNVIIATTNFGLLVSEDGGATFGWICEEAVGTNAILYQLGAPPSDLVLAVAGGGLAYSADFGCSWNRSAGDITGAFVYDAFASPVDPLRAYALARHTSYQSALESRDGYQLFGPEILRSSGVYDYLSGIESSRSSPETLYVTIYNNWPPPFRTSIARSYDGGATWERLFVAGDELNGLTARGLIAVDPVNEHRVYLRLANTIRGTEYLGIYDDDPDPESSTLRVALNMPSRMTAFLRQQDGTIIVGASNGASFISTDQGATFDPWPHAPHLRALGERNGILYAVADNYVDGYAVGHSRDQGATWEGLFRFQQITGPKNCGQLASICEGPWQTLRRTLGIPLPDAGTDAGSGTDAGNPDVDGGTGSSPEHPAHSGCGEGPAGEGSSWPFSAMIVLIFAFRLLAIRHKRP